MITAKLLQELSDEFKSNPILKGSATTEQEVHFIEKELNLKLNDDFKVFTTTFGGCIIGNSEIYGFRNSEFLGDDTIVELNRQFTSFLKDYPNAIVIGTDGSGNPVFINKEGKVLLFDHDENEEIVIAESFATYLEKCLRGEGCPA